MFLNNKIYSPGPSGSLDMVSLSNYDPFLDQNAVEDVKLVLVGNKVDLEDQRQVTLRRGEKVYCNSVLS